MKKILLLSLLFLPALVGYSQAPRIMIVPSDDWCLANGCMIEFDNQGVIERLPDYDKALLVMPDLQLAITKIGEMMSDRGYPLTDLGASLRRVRNEAIEESVTTSKNQGDVIAENPVERLQRVAEADIWLYLSFLKSVSGPRVSLTINLRGIDPYTNKQIAAAAGTGQPSTSAEIPVLIEEAIFDRIEGFNSQLMAHFEDLLENGREISVECRRWSDSDIDFESEFNGEELAYIIEDWMAENTVNGRFSLTRATENRLAFEQVRIPMKNEQGRTLSTRAWLDRGLRRMLKSNYGIESSVTMKGVGRVFLTIGEK